LKQEYNPNFKGINRQQTIPKARPATPIQSKENGTVQVDFSKF
jgi:hypothetical protein